MLRYFLWLSVWKHSLCASSFNFLLCYSCCRTGLSKSLWHWNLTFSVVVVDQWTLPVASGPADFNRTWHRVVCGPFQTGNTLRTWEVTAFCHSGVGVWYVSVCYGDVSEVLEQYFFNMIQVIIHTSDWKKKHTSQNDGFVAEQLLIAEKEKELSSLEIQSEQFWDRRFL